MKKIKTQRPDKEHKPLGRPRLTDELLDTNLQVRVTKKLADTCSRNWLPLVPLKNPKASSSLT